MIRTASWGVGELLQQPIWPGTMHPDVRVVRFIQAFPDQNRWTMVSAANHPLTPGGVDHLWQRTNDQGRLESVPAPIQANGLAIAQILTNDPIWPDAQGVLHTLPALMSTDRMVYFQMSQRIAESDGQPDTLHQLHAEFRTNPVFRRGHSGAIDPDYARYLKALHNEGLLTLDQPRNVDEVAERDQATMRLIRQLAEPHTEAPMPVPPARRSARPLR